MMFVILGHRRAMLRIEERRFRNERLDFMAGFGGARVADVCNRFSSSAMRARSSSR